MRVWDEIAKIAVLFGMDANRVAQDLYNLEVQEEDGGPGSGNWGHKGRPGMRGGSGKGGGAQNRQGSKEEGFSRKAEVAAPAASSAESKNGVSGSWKPINPPDRYTDENGQYSRDWINGNIDALMDVGIDNMKDAREEWEKVKMNETSQDLHEVSQQEAVDVVRDGIERSWLDGWFRNADSSYKPKIEERILTDPAIRNAGLNIAYENYKNDVGSDISFEEFLTTPITVYRGTHGQEEVGFDVWTSFSFSRDVAVGFGSDVEEIQVRPIDTFGSFQTTGEDEILVPRVMMKKIRSGDDEMPILEEDGGPGSGNFGHKGRPGLRGGSGKGGEKGGGETLQKQTKAASRSANQTKFSGSVSRALGRLKNDIHIKLGDDILKKQSDGYFVSIKTGEALTAKQMSDLVQMDKEDSYPRLATNEEVEAEMKKNQKVEVPSYAWTKSINSYDKSKFKSIVRGMLGRSSTDTSEYTDQDVHDAEREMATRLADPGCSFADMKKIREYNEIKSDNVGIGGVDGVFRNYLRSGGTLPNLTAEESEEFKNLVFDKWKYSEGTKNPESWGFNLYYNEALKGVMKRKDTAQRFLQLESKILGGPDPDTPEMEQERKDRARERQENAGKTRSEEQQRLIDEFDAAHKAGKDTADEMAQVRAKGQQARNYGSKFAKEVGVGHYEAMAIMVDKCDNADAVRTFDTYLGSIVIEETDLDTKRYSQHYSPALDSISINTAVNEEGTDIHVPYETTFHESGHFIDYRAGKWHNGDKNMPFSATWRNGEFYKSIQQEVQDFYDETQSRMKKEFKEHEGDRQWFIDNGYMGRYDSSVPKRVTPTLVYKDIENMIMKLPDIDRGNISDMFQGGSGGKIGTHRAGYIGHNSTYFKGESADRKCSTEAFAEMYAATFSHPESLKMIKKYFPKSYGKFNEMLKDMNK